MTSTHNEPLLRIRDLRKQFGHNEVLKGIDLDVFPGDRIALSAAQQLQLALKNKSGGAIDPHAGHNH